LAVDAEAPSLLSGLIFNGDGDGARLSPTHAVKKGKRYCFMFRRRSSLAAVLRMPKASAFLRATSKGRCSTS
jgi:hypothetical protein